MHLRSYIFLCAMIFCFTLLDYKKTLGQTMKRSLVRPLKGGTTDRHTDKKPKTENKFGQLCWQGDLFNNIF